MIDQRGETGGAARGARRTARSAVLELVLLAALTWPAWRWLLRPGYPATQDGLFHLARLTELDSLWRVGEIYPRLAPNLALGYDYPVFNYYAPLSLYVGEMFRLLGLGPPAALRAVFVLSVVGAAWSMRLFLDRIVPRGGAFLGALAYAYLPYLLVDVYVRGALAEALAMALLPVALWTVGRLARDPSLATVGVAGLGLATLILTHNITALLATPLLGAYWLYRVLGGSGAEPRAPSQDPPKTGGVSGYWTKAIGAGLGALALGLALAAFFWIPALADVPYMASSRFAGGYFDFHGHLQTVAHLFAFTPTYTYQTDFTLLDRVGIAQLALAGAGLLAAIATVGSRRGEVLFWGAVLLAALFLMWTGSVFVWEHVPLLADVQFPWRLLTVVGVASAVLIAYLGTAVGQVFAPCATMDRLRPSARRFLRLERALGVGRRVAPTAWIALLGALFAYTAIADLRPANLDLRAADVRAWTVQQQEAFFNVIASSPGEYVPFWANPRAIPDVPLAPSATPPRLTVTAAGPFSLDLVATADQPAALTLDRIFFPGWHARLDGTEVPIRASGAQGLLTIDLPAGEHRLQVWFGATPTTAASTIASAVALLFLLGIGAREIGSARAIRERIGRRGRDVADGPRREDGPADSVLSAPVQEVPDQAIGAVAFATLAFTVVLVGIGVAGGLLPRVANTSLSAAADLGDNLRLDGASEVRVDGDRLDLTLYWQALRPLDREDAVDLQVRDAGGKVVGERTKRPNFGLRSTRFWLPGELVRDHEEVGLDPGVPAGTYQLVARVVPAGSDLTAWTDARTDPAGEVSLGKLWLPARTPSEAPVGPTAPPALSNRAALDSYQIRTLDPSGDPVAARPGPSGFLAVAPGDELGVDLQWRDLHDFVDDETVFVHLTDRQGHLIAQTDGWPRQKFYPTILWMPGEVIPDEDVLRIPETAPAGLYTVSVGMYQLATRQRLPVTPGAGGDEIPVGTVKVLATTPLTVGDVSPQNREDVRFGAEVRLFGHDLTVTEGGRNVPLAGAVSAGSALGVTLYWQAPTHPTRDYTVFVQVLDSAGRLVAQTDGQPRGGDEPTTAWDPGEVVVDRHALDLPATLAPGRYRVIAGLYVLQTGARLKLPSGADYLVLGEVQVH